jgi:BMFP domain-containing protein YqiC
VDGIKPGDAIRLLGFVPAKLREALHALDAGAAGRALKAIDDLTAGLARDLRALQGELYAVETRLAGSLDDGLAPLAEAQVRAQLAVQAHFQLHADLEDRSVHAELDVSLDAIAVAGPGPLRDSLADAFGLAAGEARRAALAAGGDVDAALAGAASALERARLTSLTGGVDELLAALDPEPVAAEVDALVAAALAKAPQFLSEAGQTLVDAVHLVERLIRDLNPASQLQRFLRVLDVVREELDVLNPHTLVAQLDEVYAVLRSAVAAYDPAVLVDEIGNFLKAIAQAVRALDPSEFLRDEDLAFLTAAADRAEQAVPTKALAAVGAELDGAGKQLAAIDLVGLVHDVDAVADKVDKALHAAVQEIQKEIEALVHSLQFASTNASASVAVAA